MSVVTYEGHTYVGNYKFGTYDRVYYYFSFKAEMELTTGYTKFYAGLFGRTTQDWNGVEIGLSPMIAPKNCYWCGSTSNGSGGMKYTFSTYKGGNEYEQIATATLATGSHPYTLYLSNIQTYAYRIYKTKFYNFKPEGNFSVSFTIVRDGTAPTGTASVTINRLGTVGSTTTTASQSPYGIEDEYFSLSIDNKSVWEKRYRSGVVPVNPYTVNVSSYLNSRFPNGSARNKPYKFVHQFTAGNGLSGENIVTGEIKSNLVSLSARNRVYNVGDVVPLYDLFKAEGYDGYDITVDYGTYLNFTIKGTCPSGITYDSTTRKFTCNTSGLVTISIKVDESCDAYSEAEVTEINNIQFLIIDYNSMPTFTTPVYRFDTTLVLQFYAACKYLKSDTPVLEDYNGTATTYYGTFSVCSQLHNYICAAIREYDYGYYLECVEAGLLKALNENEGTVWHTRVNGWITALQGCV